MLTHKDSRRNEIYSLLHVANMTMKLQDQIQRGRKRVILKKELFEENLKLTEDLLLILRIFSFIHLP